MRDYKRKEMREMFLFLCFAGNGSGGGGEGKVILWFAVYRIIMYCILLRLRVLDHNIFTINYKLYQ